MLIESHTRGSKLLDVVNLKAFLFVVTRALVCLAEYVRLLDLVRNLCLS